MTNPDAPKCQDCGTEMIHRCGEILVTDEDTRSWCWWACPCCEPGFDGDDRSRCPGEEIAQ